MISLFVFISLLVTITASSSNEESLDFSMPRILLLILLVWILYLIFKRVSANLSQDAKKSKQTENEKMVLCSKCGCHIPVSESLLKDGQTICNNPACDKS